MKLMTYADSDGVYGTGWAFPPAFDVQVGPAMVRDATDIQQSMLILFNTSPLERVMRRDFGCDLHSLVFENISDELVARVTSVIQDAVSRHEPRVTLTAVAVERDLLQPGVLHILVAYRIRGIDEIMRMDGMIDIADGQGRMFT